MGVDQSLNSSYWFNLYSDIFIKLISVKETILFPWFNLIFLSQVNMNQTTTSANGPATMKVNTFFTYYKPHAIRNPILTTNALLITFMHSNFLETFRLIIFEACLTYRGLEVFLIWLRLALNQNQTHIDTLKYLNFLLWFTSQGRRSRGRGALEILAENLF